MKGLISAVYVDYGNILVLWFSGYCNNEVINLYHQVILFPGLNIVLFYMFISIAIVNIRLHLLPFSHVCKLARDCFI